VRDTLYEKIVAPLSWLASVGYGDDVETPLIPLHEAVVIRKHASTDHLEFDVFQAKTQMRDAFTPGTQKTRNFLHDLKSVAALVMRQRQHIELENRKPIGDKPIRLAVLDTGCDTGLSFFKDDRRLRQLKGWKDFSEATAEHALDDCGHGTLMTRLIMHVAPMVDIYLIRVATNSEHLEENEENIAKVHIQSSISRSLLTSLGNRARRATSRLESGRCFHVLWIF
jgi:hypothetical protein